MLWVGAVLVFCDAVGAGAQLVHRYEGQWYPGLRLIDNTQIFHLLIAAAGVPQPPVQTLKRSVQGP